MEEEEQEEEGQTFFRNTSKCYAQTVINYYTNTGVAFIYPIPLCGPNEQTYRARDTGLNNPSTT